MTILGAKMAEGGWKSSFLVTPFLTERRTGGLASQADTISE